MKKINEEIVKREFEKRGYKMIGHYEKYNEPILSEKDGYKFKMSYGHLLEENKPNFFGKRNIYQQENIRKFIKNKNKDIHLINIKNIKKGGKDRIVIEMKCSCGNDFVMTWDKVKNNEYLLCNKCSRKIISKTRKKRYNDKYIKNLESQNFKILNKSQDIYALERIEVEDNITKFRGFVSPFKKNINMLIFSLEHNKKNYIHNTNVIIKNNGYDTIALNLVDNDSKILAKCECGKYYKANLRSFYKGNCVCENCSSKMSNNERIIKNYLDELQLNYIQEFIINSCRDSYPLPFDFYIKDKNILLEIDGEQHEHPVLFDGNYEKAKKRFEIQKYHDNIKNLYCKNYNIPLLRISYKEINDNSYKNKIKKFIQTV